MLTGILIFFELNRCSVLSGCTDSLFPIIHAKTSLMQDSREEKAEEDNSGEYNTM